MTLFDYYLKNSLTSRTHYIRNYSSCNCIVELCGYQNQTCQTVIILHKQSLKHRNLKNVYVLNNFRVVLRSFMSKKLQIFFVPNAFWIPRSVAVQTLHYFKESSCIKTSNKFGFCVIIRLFFYPENCKPFFFEKRKSIFSIASFFFRQLWSF